MYIQLSVMGRTCQYSWLRGARDDMIIRTSDNERGVQLGDYWRAIPLVYSREAPGGACRMVMK